MAKEPLLKRVIANGYNPLVERLRVAGYIQLKVTHPFSSKYSTSISGLIFRGFVYN